MAVITYEGHILVTPKYITAHVCNMAIKMAFAAHELLPFGHDDHDCSIQIIVPAMVIGKEGEDVSKWLESKSRLIANPVYPFVFFDSNNGEASDWVHEYDKIARSKAIQLVQDRSSQAGGTIAHMIFDGETPYWGGVKEDRLLVLCSGFDQWLDRSYAGVTKEGIIVQARHAFEKDPGREGQDFLAFSRPD